MYYEEFYMTYTDYHRAIRSWYLSHARDLPWRRTRDPYIILVSEVMLQQTQVERVIGKLAEFLEVFPTIVDLASATTGDVLRVWKGLGYNSRALRLQKTAQAVVERFDGVIPRDIEELRSLPGVGPYTAGAIRCFAYEESVSFADININRIVHRVFVGEEITGWKIPPKELSLLVQAAADMEHAYDYHQALMDLGSQLCRATKLQCHMCPLKDMCETRRQIQSNPMIVKEKRVTYTKQKEPFKETKRFLRGRIVDHLRESTEGATREEIFAYIRGRHAHFEEKKAVESLTDLLREGVIKKKGNKYTL